MDLAKTIRQLKDAGYQVKVVHERATQEDVEAALEARELGERLALPEMKQKKDIPNGKISAFGGRTLVTIYRDDLIQAAGEAICSPVDQFVRRTGTSKALGRAISALRHFDQQTAWMINTGKG